MYKLELKKAGDRSLEFQFESEDCEPRKPWVSILMQE